MKRILQLTVFTLLFLIQGVSAEEALSSELSADGKVWNTTHQDYFNNVIQAYGGIPSIYLKSDGTIVSSRNFHTQDLSIFPLQFDEKFSVRKVVNTTYTNQMYDPDFGAVLTYDGSVWAFDGDESDIGDRYSNSSVPQKLPWNNIVDIVAGEDFLAALDKDGKVFIQGRLYGYQGYSSVLAERTYTRIWQNIHSLFLLDEEQTLWMIGVSIGDNYRNNFSNPVKVLENVKDFVSGNAIFALPDNTGNIATTRFAVAVSTDNKIWTWGGNEIGSLGEAESRRVDVSGNVWYDITFWDDEDGTALVTNDRSTPGIPSALQREKQVKRLGLDSNQKPFIEYGDGTAIQWRFTTVTDLPSAPLSEYGVGYHDKTIGEQTLRFWPNDNLGTFVDENDTV